MVAWTKVWMKRSLEDEESNRNIGLGTVKEAGFLGKKGFSKVKE